MDPIAPIETLIDKTQDLLGHSPHPAVVALPLGAFAVSNACDGLALLTGEDRYDDAARISMAIGLVGAAASVVTGLRDYAKIPAERPSHAVATRHALGNAAVGTLFAASYVLREHDHLSGRRAGLASRLMGLLGGGLALYTAWLGGVLVENMGEAVEPYMARLQSEEQGRGHEHGHDDTRGRGRLSPAAPLGPHAE
jgi:uncharacterized membrane protein